MSGPTSPTTCWCSIFNLPQHVRELYLYHLDHLYERASRSRTAMCHCCCSRAVAATEIRHLCSCPQRVPVAGEYARPTIYMRAWWPQSILDSTLVDLKPRPQKDDDRLASPSDATSGLLTITTCRYCCPPALAADMPEQAEVLPRYQDSIDGWLCKGSACPRCRWWSTGICTCMWRWR